MKSRVHVFNGFLAALLLASLFSGCSTSEERKRRKEFSNVRIHVEAPASDSGAPITVIRAAPVEMKVERYPLLDENSVLAAAIDEHMGGFMIRIQFDRKGSWILEQATVANRGRRLAIHAVFGPARWLAAPLITGKNSSGSLSFTPDCTREEAERFVRGLNNATRKLQREDWPFVSPIDR